ncbi:MAG: transglycosylase domain-containing protein, partial [Proteobacteria bacterium]|nr:transglycosylase domain-containing protein [Pseudomonadota bacterium]
MDKRKTKSQVLKNRSRKKGTNLLLSIIKWFLIIILITGLAGVAGMTGIYFYLSRDLPKINSMEDYRPSTVTSVFSDDGRKIGEFYEERRIVIPLSDMPKNLINAFVAAEDSRFREHPGIDILSILRAFFK